MKEVLRLASHGRPAWLLLLSCVFQPASATPVHWTVAPATIRGVFDQSQTALFSGDFFYDAQTNSYSDWDFSLSGFTGPHSGLNGVITSANSSVATEASSAFRLTWSDSPNRLSMGFQPALTGAGGIVLTPIQVSTVLPSFGTFIATGESAATGRPDAVPEPAVGVLVLLGAIALCFWKRP